MAKKPIQKKKFQNLHLTGKRRDFGDAKLISKTDLKGKIIYSNESFADVAGYKIDEMLGKPHNIVRHPDMPQAAYKDLWDTIQAGKNWMGIVTNRSTNGDHYEVNAFVMPIKVNGKISEYRSVRTRPKEEWVDRANTSYKLLNNGKSPFPWYANKMKVFKLFGVLMSLFIPVMAGLAFFGGLGLDVLSGAMASGVVVGAGISQFVAMKELRVQGDAKSVFDNKLMQWIYTGRMDAIGAD